MFGVIGWNEVKAGPLGLRTHILVQVGDLVTLEPTGLWEPQVGDTITDGVLTDVVVQVLSMTSVRTRTATGFVLGFFDVIPRKRPRLRSVANFVGNVVGSDNGNLRRTDVSIGCGSVAEHTLIASTGALGVTALPDWLFASIILLDPDGPGHEIAGAHWASWQLVKLLVNVSTVESFDVRNQSGNFPEDDIRVAGTFGVETVTVPPGGAFIIVRHPIEDRWRGSIATGRELTFGVIAGTDNVIADTDEVIVN